MVVLQAATLAGNIGIVFLALKRGYVTVSTIFKGLFRFLMSLFFQNRYAVGKSACLSSKCDLWGIFLIFLKCRLHCIQILSDPKKVLLFDKSLNSGLLFYCLNIF